MSFYYLDTSAIVKLFKSETESSALKKQIGTQLISSAISRLEVKRVIDRYPQEFSKPGLEVLDNLQFIEVDQSILAIAESIKNQPFLRSLDAIHLASAIFTKPIISEFIAYDERLLAAATSLGFNVRSPGAKKS